MKERYKIVYQGGEGEGTVCGVVLLPSVEEA